MLIPAIDLKGGKVVQLIQGEKLAVETSDLDYWIGRFAGFPRVNVIDLAFVAASIAITAYVFLNFETVIYRVNSPNQWDFVFGVIAIVTVLSQRIGGRGPLVVAGPALAVLTVDSLRHLPRRGTGHVPAAAGHAARRAPPVFPSP